jgi:hypothetical protein
MPPFALLPGRGDWESAGRRVAPVISSVAGSATAHLPGVRQPSQPPSGSRPPPDPSDELRHCERRRPGRDAAGSNRYALRLSAIRALSVRDWDDTVAVRCTMHR